MRSHRKPSKALAASLTHLFTPLPLSPRAQMEVERLELLALGVVPESIEAITGELDTPVGE